jgi:putative salt-induced outer membrane protein
MPPSKMSRSQTARPPNDQEGIAVTTFNAALRVAFTASLGLIAIQAHAEWKGKGELGAVIARGNTDAETINAKIDMTTEHDPWKHLVGFSALRSTNADVTTGDRYEFHGQSDYKLTETSYALGSLRYENDKFSPYNYQAVASIGYGYKFFDTDATKLAAEIGVGYRRAEDHLTGEVQGDAIARGGINFDYKLTTNSAVYDKFLVESGSDNTYIQNEAGVKANINESLALSIEHLIRHNSNVDPPLRHTDQLLTANLVFSF